MFLRIERDWILNGSLLGGVGRRRTNDGDLLERELLGNVATID